MSVPAEARTDLAARVGVPHLARLRRFDLVGLLLTLATLALAVLWAFPLYWGMVTTFKPEYEVVRAGVNFWPEHFTIENYWYALFETKIGDWYLNSLVTSLAVTILVVIMAAGA